MQTVRCISQGMDATKVCYSVGCGRGHSMLNVLRALMRMNMKFEVRSRWNANHVGEVAILMRPQILWCGRHDRPCLTSELCVLFEGLLGKRKVLLECLRGAAM